MRIAAVAVTLVLVFAGPASAGTPASPELADDCGVGAHVATEQVLPWLDICRGWFETLSEPGDTPVVRVTLELAGDLAHRTDSYYRMSWTSGDCAFSAERYDAGTETAPGDPEVLLAVRCGGVPQVPCQPPILEDLGFACFELPDPVYYDLDGFSEQGSRVSWTVRFDGELARYAPGHESGTVLTATEAMTTAAAAGRPLYLGNGCTGADGSQDNCWDRVGDWVNEGLDYVVGS